MIWRLTILVTAAFLLSGCAPKQYIVHVSGLARDGQATDGARAEGVTYELRPADPEMREDDLMFIQVAGLVERGLEEMGYHLEPEGGAAQEVIYLDFGLSEPIVQETFETRPVAPSTYAQVHPAHSPSIGLGFSYNTGYDSTYRKRRAVTYYDTILTLDAVEAIPGEPDEGAQVWSLRANVRTPSQDVRYLVPYLIVASFEYWGTDTGRGIEVPIVRGDPRTDQLRLGKDGWSEPLEDDQ